MRYFIDHDQGVAIRGWIVPDNPLAISRVVVAVDGRRVAEVPASVIDEAFKRNGWHATGQCTFVVTEAEVPGLTEIPRLELYDADTNVMVYRRVPPEGLVRLRTMLINTGIEPETVLQTALFPHFQHCYFGIHKLPDEILTCVLTGPAAPSAFLSGAVTVPRYENFLTPDLMITAILLQEPQIEMATRMRWLKARAGDAADPARSWRLGPLAEAAAFAEGYDFSDVKSLKRFFRMLPEPAYRLLYNPLTRQLGTRMPDDRLHPGNSIAAIEILARVGIVGHKSRFPAFASTLFDRLGIAKPIPALPPVPAETMALAERLKAVKAVEDMIVFDVAMSDAVKASVDKSWS
ncbi:hypothetical protein MCBMB27_01358 [Methylobacterium phyllosphaerae]|uniref:Uncharacterized protein n=2 Tax=Methylobacterium TaxID=407 RepID=A0AAE8HMR4_9HYPH|nr:hypothetical protein [Methylobacterium phyllosphaerae]APT30649.1 hypothetical protein MCBMB27_01358 [Methylobacterium phyllosphaerae]SFG22662.1 hypothetical protein SAMN05192567_101144 [Methylobacterium phyllosphaerae]